MMYSDLQQHTMPKVQQTLDGWLSSNPSLFDAVLPPLEIPSFPSEILTAVFEYLPRQDLMSLLACSRTFRAVSASNRRSWSREGRKGGELDLELTFSFLCFQISRPLLFRNITIRTRDGFAKVLCIAQTLELAALVR